MQKEFMFLLFLFLYILFADWSVNTCNGIIFIHTHTVCTATTNTHAHATALTNTSTRVSHSCDHVCRVSMFYDVIIRCRHRIALFCVPITWCASAYNEDDLAWESLYTRLRGL